MYILPHPTAPDQVYADHPDHSDSVHIARYPCATPPSRESSADIQVDLPKITQVVLAVDGSLCFEGRSHGPRSKSKHVQQSCSKHVRNLPDTGDRYTESHLFPPPFRHNPIRDRVRVVARCLHRLGRCHHRGIISCSRVAERSILSSTR